MNEQFWIAAYNALCHIRFLRRAHPENIPRHDPGFAYVNELRRQLIENIGSAPEWHRKEYAAGRFNP